ncbi:hypothetical protein VU12_15125, partial [Desulfobulbus sp. US4]|nr:hypothetical protein [Desulfobulbus sp. US4]
MKHQSLVVLLTATVVLSAVFFFISPLQAAEKKEKFDIAWSHYAGWEPWGYAQQSGILKKWADKHNIEIELTLVNDYIESINLYTTG